MMPSVGPLEIAVVLIIALVIFGPKRIPELGNSLGKGIREFKGSVSGERQSPEADDEGGKAGPRQLGSGMSSSSEPVETKVNAG